VTPLEMASKLRELAGEKGLKKVISNGMRRGLRVGKKVALKTLRGSGVGRALWIKRGSGVAPVKVSYPNVRQSRNTYTSALQEKGMAALIEKGGRTRPHREKRWGRPETMLHPGSIVPSNPHLEAAAAAAASAIPGEIETGFAQALQKLGL
jgi:hypothetical protein